MPEEIIETITPLTEAEQQQKDKEDAMWAEIWEKAAALSKNLGYKVFPIVVQSVEEEGAFVIGYARKPVIVTQCRLIDKSEGSIYGISLEAAASAMEALVIVSESDPRITDKNGEYYDVYWKGAAYSLKQFMGLAIPVLKKK